MNTAWYAVPLWISFIVTIIGLIFTLVIARYAYKSVMFNFTLILALGILVFAVHHIFDLTLRPMLAISESFEVLSSLIFLIATVYLDLVLRKLL